MCKHNFISMLKCLKCIDIINKMICAIHWCIACVMLDCCVSAGACKTKQFACLSFFFYRENDTIRSNWMMCTFRIDRTTILLPWHLICCQWCCVAVDKRNLHTRYVIIFREMEEAKHDLFALTRVVINAILFYW